MSVGRGHDNDWRATQEYSGLTELDEPSSIVPEVAADRNDRAGAVWIDQFELRSARNQSARPRAEGIRIDRLDRAVLAPADPVRERVLRAAIVVALLLVTVLCLVWIGGSPWVRIPAPVLTQKVASLPDPAPAPANPAPSSTKGDRLPVSIEELAARESSAELSPKAPEPNRLQAPEPNRLHAPTPSKELLAPRLQAQPQRAEPPAPRAPVPETRPATIPGWTVREVLGDSAVLDGPQGVRRVARGESVPGLGRVETIVRWGNRWIVTTERGLISTN
jgi:hypothetical protein